MWSRSDRSNIPSRGTDADTVASFGDEWSRFDQSALPSEEARVLFGRYFEIFDWASLPDGAEGFDMGCGSGRWAAQVAPRVGRLNCIDPSRAALSVARGNLADNGNVTLIVGDTDHPGLSPGTQDFGYSLGVLHHTPDTQRALASCVELLKPGSPFLVYLYYRFDNRPAWFRLLWRVSDVVRRGVSKLSPAPKIVITEVIAFGVYWPLARLSAAVERCGRNASRLPLHFYRDKSLYTMRTDSRDRFGTPLEGRFTRAEISEMLANAGLRDLRFLEDAPYWVVTGVKRAA